MHVLIIGSGRMPTTDMNYNVIVLLTSFLNINDRTPPHMNAQNTIPRTIPYCNVKHLCIKTKQN